MIFIFTINGSKQQLNNCKKLDSCLSFQHSRGAQISSSNPGAPNEKQPPSSCYPRFRGIMHAKPNVIINNASKKKSGTISSSHTLFFQHRSSPRLRKSLLCLSLPSAQVPRTVGSEPHTFIISILAFSRLVTAPARFQLTPLR